MSDQYADLDRTGPRTTAGTDAVSGTNGADAPPAGTNPDRVSASTADLIRMATEQVSQLVRKELRLASVEMAQKGKRAGIGAGLFGAAGAMAFYGGGALVVMVGFLFAYVMPAWVAALVTAALLFAVAGIAALLGRSQVRRAGTLMPEEAVESTSADVATVMQAAKGGEH